MSATEATIWMVSTAIAVLIVIGGGILMASNVLHHPHLPHRHH